MSLAAKGSSASGERSWLFSPTLVRGLFVTILFLVAFVPRVVQPVSRPLVWYLRSAYFLEDILTGSLADAVYSEHPGVPFMWMAGIGLKVYWALSGIRPAAESVPPDFEPIHFFGPVPVNEIAAALVPVAVFIALAILGAYLLLRRLFGARTGVVAGLLLALSPYYLAQSKVLHLDATMAALMLLSALTMLVYRREAHWRWVALSGALGGLAVLTKIPAVFLVPFCALVLLADLALEPPRSPRAIVSRLFLPMGLWLLAAAAVYVLAWPVMWVDPGKGLAAVSSGVTRHLTTAHDSPTLFLGQVTRDDPGPLFYVVSLVFRMSEVELVFLVTGALAVAGSLVRRAQPPREAQRNAPARSLDYALLVVYAVAYLAQMSLGAKKMPRYVLPSLMALTILAAAGIVAWAEGLAAGRRRPQLALMVLPVLIQAAVILPRHPYYGTWLNWLAGGPPAAANAILIGEEGEGYAELTSYLNAQPSASDLTAAAQLKHVFNQTFRGTTVEVGEGAATPSGEADYVAFHRNYTSRDYKIDAWGPVWERYAARTPERMVSFDGVPYAWLYAKVPADAQPEYCTEFAFGDQFELLGYDLQTSDVRPGDEISLVFYWQATAPVTQDLSIFVHLLGPEGFLVWQDDGAANHGERPTWSWAPGEIVVDPHTVKLPPDLAEGDYILTAGLYDWQTGERLRVTASSEDGASDRVMVRTLSVRPRKPAIEAWISRMLGAIVLATFLLTASQRRSSNQPSLAGDPPSR